jgi:hypothetical protein
MINLFETLKSASMALEKNDLHEANSIIFDIENEIKSTKSSRENEAVKKGIGGLLIDIGSEEKDKTKIIRGISYLEENIADSSSPTFLYNIANGYAALWDLSRRDCLINGKLDNSIFKAKNFFRKAIINSKIKRERNYDLHNQILVNLANLYDSVNRSVEAIPLYDEVINNNNKMAMALGNKGITLTRLAPLIYGYTHTFYLEAYRLLNAAIKEPVYETARNSFNYHREFLEKIIEQHHGMKPEKIRNSKPINNFHRFLRDFCYINGLFLSPTSLIGLRKRVIFGDPLYISRMQAPINDDSKFDRYITFLNQIKQDYILARYLLVQSQYESELIESIDQNVILYYPLDYSLNSSYIQMLTASFRLAVDVLDKIASFVYDYYHINSLPKTDVYFRSLFSKDYSSYTLRPELSNKKNPYLFALFDLSIDLHKKGDYDFINDRRNALTHRFLVIHDIVIDHANNPDIPRIILDDFINECIQTMQITRAAVMYLIMMVDYEENSKRNRDKAIPIIGTKVDSVFRWVPPNRGNN